MTAIVSQLSQCPRGSHISLGRRRVFGELDDVIHYSSFAPSTYFRTRDSSAKGVYGKIERMSPSPRKYSLYIIDFNAKMGDIGPQSTLDWSAFF